MFDVYPSMLQAKARPSRSQHVQNMMQRATSFGAKGILFQMQNVPSDDNMAQFLQQGIPRLQLRGEGGVWRESGADVSKKSTKTVMNSKESEVINLHVGGLSHSVVLSLDDMIREEIQRSTLLTNKYQALLRTNKTIRLQCIQEGREDLIRLADANRLLKDSTGTYNYNCQP